MKKVVYKYNRDQDIETRLHIPMYAEIDNHTYQCLAMHYDLYDKPYFDDTTILPFPCQIDYRTWFYINGVWKPFRASDNTYPTTVYDDMHNNKNFEIVVIKKELVLNIQDRR